MCGPAVAWDWIVLDIAFVLCLMGSAVILRSRSAHVETWAVYGLFAAGVGGFLMWATFATQRTMADVGAAQATAALVGC